VVRSVMALPLPFFFATIIYEKYIRVEETALEKRFGSTYQEYKDRVRRWL
jgi:protein-S-isoprenylcysteine O-methyltransferase Ste14